MHKIAVVIVTHNSDRNIKRCLDSVFNQGFGGSEVIVVDNNSNDRTKDILAGYPRVLVIENRDNFGPAKARNEGIIKATADFIVCLDDDVVLKQNFLVIMYKAITGRRGIGAVAPKILMADGKTIYSAGIFLSFLRRFHDIGSGQQDQDKFNHEELVFGASSAAVMYSRQALEAIRHKSEYFDEDFFYLAEDVDVSWRLQRKGWRILYSPFAECLHNAGGSRSKDKLFQYLCFRNRYLLMLKNEPYLVLPRLFISFFVYDLWRNLFLLVVNTRYFMKGVFEVLKLSLRMIGKYG